jgi:hypothetical protein
MKSNVVLVGVVISLAALAGCNKQTPETPPASAVVVPSNSASAPFPVGPASDPSLPSAAAVASQPASSAAPETPTPVASSPASAASQP